MELKIFIQKKALEVEKRLRFAGSAVLLSLLMLISTAFFFNASIVFIPLLIIFSYLLTYFSVLEGVERVEWFTLFFMPVALTIAFYLSYFLFPSRWLTRLPFIFIYGISVYAVMLCANIFNVGVEKSLQLYRAAFSINFFYQTIVSFLFFNIIFSLKLNFLLNGFLVGLTVFVMSLQLLWTIKLEGAISREIQLYSLLAAVTIGQLAMVLSFVPLASTIFSLFLTATYYSLIGLIYNYLAQRLFKETVREYLLVLLVVTIIVLLSVSW